MAPRSRLPTILALGLTALWGCASAAGGVPEQCRSNLPPDPRSLQEVVDSLALQRGVEAAWEEGAGLTLATLTFDSTGASRRVDIISESVGDPARQAFREALDETARRTGEPRERIFLFLGDGRGPGVRRVAIHRGCAPEILNHDLVLTRLQTESRRLGLEESQTVGLWVQVQLDGRAGEVRVAESSGEREVDAVAVRVLRTAIFRPGMIEGIPVGGIWARFPVNFFVIRE